MRRNTVSVRAADASCCFVASGVRKPMLAVWHHVNDIQFQAHSLHRITWDEWPPVWLQSCNAKNKSHRLKLATNPTKTHLTMLDSEDWYEGVVWRLEVIEDRHSSLATPTLTCLNFLWGDRKGVCSKHQLFLTDRLGRRPSYPPRHTLTSLIPIFSSQLFSLVGWSFQPPPQQRKQRRQGYFPYLPLQRVKVVQDLQTLSKVAESTLSKNSACKKNWESSIWCACVCRCRQQKPACYFVCCRAIYRLWISFSDTAQVKETLLVFGGSKAGWSCRSLQEGCLWGYTDSF